MYIERLAENLVQEAFSVLEIYSFEVDAYMYCATEAAFELHSRK
jgi:hypothetical protein